MKAAERLVKRGAKLLDSKLPGWHQQIAITKLDMGDECRCVLGQIGGKTVNLDRMGWEPKPESDNSYGAACGALGLSLDGTGRFGFDIVGPSRGLTYEELEAAWLAEIRARRAADKAAKSDA